MQRFTVIGEESHPPLRVEDALKLEKLIQDLGLNAIITPNPASILASLQIRKSVKPHDQFYGIQSVFNLGMQGDYRRPLESVRAEFISHIWTEFSPVLALSLNRPVITDISGHFMIDTEDTLVWFSRSAMEDGRLSCLPLGYSKIRASATPEGKPVLVSSECEDIDSDPWRYEAVSEPPCHSKILGIRFGLPPLPVEFSQAKTMDDLYQDSPSDRLKSKSWYRRYTQWCSRKLEGWQDRRGTSSFMQRTTRLLYVGKFINESGHLGLRRYPHVYIEYYLKGPGKGHRVGALVSDLEFGHRKVSGALTLD